MTTKKIAIIDDDVLILDLYLRKFRDRGYEVMTMNDQTLSLPELLAFAPQVILLDINMPTKSGLDVLQELRDTFPLLPYVILLTNNDDKSLADKGKELGARDHIVKVSKTPSEIADIVDSVEKEIL